MICGAYEHRLVPAIKSGLNFILPSFIRLSLALEHSGDLLSLIHLLLASEVLGGSKGPRTANLNTVYLYKGKLYTATFTP